MENREDISTNNEITTKKRRVFFMSNEYREGYKEGYNEGFKDGWNSRVCVEEKEKLKESKTKKISGYF